MRRKTNSSWSCIFSKGFDSGEISSGRVKHNNKTSSMVSPIHKRLRGFAVQLFRDISPKSSTPVEENITKNIQLWQVIQEADHPPTERRVEGQEVIVCGNTLKSSIEMKGKKVVMYIYFSSFNHQLLHMWKQFLSWIRHHLTQLLIIYKPRLSTEHK